MEASLKAKALVDRFENIGSTDIVVGSLWEKGYILSQDEAKQCALICVDEILKEILSTPNVYELDTYYYWKEVKQEINKL